MGLIFLRYADWKFTQAEKELKDKGSSRRGISASDYQARSVMFLPEAARFSKLLDLPEGADIGKAINEAMKAIEDENTQLNKLETTTEAFARTKIWDDAVEAILSSPNRPNRPQAGSLGLQEQSLPSQADILAHEGGLGNCSRTLEGVGGVLTEEELAIFDLLTKPQIELSQVEQKQVKQVAKELLTILKTEKLVLDWRKRQQTKASVEVAIKDILDRLPESYSIELYNQKCQEAFQHIYESYNGKERNISES